MGRGITMRELQKISASAIRDLPGTVPIKSGGETVAWLMPVRPPDPEQLRKVLDRIGERQITLTPEERREIESVVGELDLD